MRHSSKYQISTLKGFQKYSEDEPDLSGLPVERKTAQSPTVMVSSSLLIFWWYSFLAWRRGMSLVSHCSNGLVVGMDDVSVMPGLFTIMFLDTTETEIINGPTNTSNSLDILGIFPIMCDIINNGREKIVPEESYLR